MRSESLRNPLLVRQILARVLLQSWVVLLVLVLFQADARAAVDISVQPETGTVEDSFTLSVTVSGESANEIRPPRFDESPHFSVTRVGTTQSHEFVGGRQSFSLTFNYQLLPTTGLAPGVYPTPGGTIEVKGLTLVLRSKEVSIIAIDDPRGARLQSPVRIMHSIEPTSPYVGQQVLYLTRIVTTPDFREGNLGDPKIEGLWREKLGQFEKTEEIYGDHRVTNVAEVLIPTEAGELVIGPREIAARVRVGSNPRRRGMFSGFPFDDVASIAQKRYATTPLPLVTKPLPPAPAHKQNYIPVGTLRMRSTVEPKEIELGESVTLTLVLSGTGNLRPLELPPATEVRGEFKQYDDRPELTIDPQRGQVIFTKVFKIAIVPREAGSFLTPGFSFLYFDPSLGSYQTLRSEQLLIKVDPSTQSAIEPTGSRAASSASSGLPAKSAVTILGSDLLPQHEGAATLVPQPRLPAWVFYAVLLLAPLLAIALRVFISRNQLWAGDPARKLQAEAFDKAMRSLASTEDQSAEQLLKTITGFLGERFRKSGASLTAVESEELVRSSTGDETLAEETAVLLRRLQTLVYANLPTSGSSASEVAEYGSRAKVLLEKLNAAARSALVLILLVCSLLKTDVSAADPSTLVVEGTQNYGQGNFETAVERYRQALAEGVDNAHVHYNLANAYYRLKQYGLAIAHYQEARRRAPHDADIAANLSLARTHAVDRIEEPTDISTQLQRLLGVRAWLTEYQLELVFIILYAVFWFAFVLEPVGKFGFGKQTTRVSVAALLCWTFLTFGTRLDRTGRPVVAFTPAARGMQAGVIVPPEVKVYSGNSDQFQVVFVLHMGAEVDVSERRGDWIQVVLPATQATSAEPSAASRERRGWIRASECYVIS